MIKISVVLPMCNKMRCTIRAIRAVLSSGNIENLELIIVNNSSGEISKSRVENFIHPYSNVSMINLEERSRFPHELYSIGVENARGEYVILLKNRGDRMIPDSLLSLAALAKKEDPDFIVSKKLLIDQLRNRDLCGLSEELQTVRILDDSTRSEIFAQREGISLASLMLKKELIRNALRSIPSSINLSLESLILLYVLVNAKTLSASSSALFRRKYGCSRVTLTDYEELPEFMNCVRLILGDKYCDEVVASRIISILNDVYVRDLTRFHPLAEIDVAMSLMRRACSDYGVDLLKRTENEAQIEMVDDILNERTEVQFARHFNLEIEKSRQLVDQAFRKIKRMKAKNKKIERQFNGRLMRAAMRILRIKCVKRKKERRIKRNHTLLKQIEKREEAYKLKKDYKGYWVFSDRQHAGLDNAEALYRYIKENEAYSDIAFLMSKDSMHYDRLKKDGFNVIEWDSVEHYSALMGCEYYFASHCDEYMLEPWNFIGRRRYEHDLRFPQEYNLIFLQHGVIRSDLSRWLGKKCFHKFITSSPYEEAALLNIPGYRLAQPTIISSGLPRYDLLKDVSCESEERIIFFPTWRPVMSRWRGKEKSKEFFAHAVAKNWMQFFENEDLLQIIHSKKIKFDFILHNEYFNFVDEFREILPRGVNFYSYAEVDSFSRLVNEGRALVTDYSSFSFDFLYLGKPVIYFDFERNSEVVNVRGMEYDRFGFFEALPDEASNKLVSLIENGYKLPKDKIDLLNDTFYRPDDGHCAYLVGELMREDRKSVL